MVRRRRVYGQHGEVRVEVVRPVIWRAEPDVLGHLELAGLSVVHGPCAMRVLRCRHRRPCPLAACLGLRVGLSLVLLVLVLFLLVPLVGRGGRIGWGVDGGDGWGVEAVVAGRGGGVGGRVFGKGGFRWVRWVVVNEEGFDMVDE